MAFMHHTILNFAKAAAPGATNSVSATTDFLTLSHVPSLSVSSASPITPSHPRSLQPFSSRYS